MDERRPSNYLDRDEIGEHVTADMISAALAVIEADAMIDGAHHKQWVIDQALRALLGEALYARWVRAYNGDSVELDYAPWEEGIAP